MRSSPEVLRLSLDDLAAVPPAKRGTAIAIGNFDGVHRGHQALIAAARETAAELDVEPAVLTFEPHPRTVLRPEQPTFRLNTPDDRAALIRAAGVTRIFELRFDPSVAALSPEAFIDRVLVGALGARAVLTGRDFRFGNRRAGDAAYLAEAGAARGFTVRAIPPVSDGSGAIFSSGRVRDALSAGDVAGANDVLGYRWSLTGTVIHGDKRGRELGFPTANIRVEDGNRLRHGIYAVTAAGPDGRPMPAVASFGVRPTFGPGGGALLEVHIFDFNGDLYGTDLRVTFLDWLRPEERFTSIESLVAQINADAEEARRILRDADAGTAIDRALARDVAGESAIA